MDFLIVDGEIYRIQDRKPIDFTYQSSVRLTKKCWYGYGGIPLLQENINVIKNQLNILHLPVPDIFAHKDEMFRIVKRMLNKNKLYRSGYVRFNIYADKKSTHWIADCNAFEYFDFPLDNRGVLLEVAKERKLSSSKHSDLPFFNKTLWQQVVSQQNDIGSFQKIIINERNEICETPYANLFFRKENILMTPPINSASYKDTLSPVIQDVARKIGLQYEDTLPINADSLHFFDEILIIGEEVGIIRVLGIDQKRFIPKYNTVFYEKINNILKKKSI